MKLRVHLWTLPRWFAAPLFGGSALLGALLAGGMTFNSWLGVIASLLIMAGGHSFNSFLDYSWTGLDREKSPNEVPRKTIRAARALSREGWPARRRWPSNAIGWYALALAPLSTWR